MFTLSDRNELLKTKKVAIAGYGNQGRPQALNLKDSGINPRIALRRGSQSEKRARDDGFDVITPDTAVKESDVIIVLIPDEAHGSFFEDYVYPHIHEGMTFIFAHGFSTVFGGIRLKEYPVNIGMVSPKGPGTALRSRFLSGEGLPGVLAVEKAVTDDLKELLLSYAYYAGMLKKGVHETTFREETVCDLFGEQAALCGGTIHVMKACYDTLVEGGYSPEMAYFETVFEMKAIIDMVYEKGIEYMRVKISDTAEFGAYEAAEKLFGDDFNAKLKAMLADIENGGFAKRWLEDYKQGRTALTERREDEKRSSVISTERKMHNEGLI